MGVIGRSIRRLEDARLLRGEGRFVDGIDLPGQAWMRVVRSHLAHGTIRVIDHSTARALPGVIAVLTGDDLARVPPIPVRTNVSEHDLSPYLQPLLARERVRYVGEPVAAVVAEDPYLAEDAAELISVEIDPLPVVMDARLAIDRDAPPLFDGGNEAATLRYAYGAVDGSFAGAAHVVRAELEIGRHSGVPLETRGSIAAYDVGADGLEIWGATKVPHFNREVLAGLMGMSPDRIHMHASDAGGGFGVRGEFYPEDFLVPYLAKATGRPVKWIEDRAEHLQATNHSRQQVHALRAAFDEGLRLLALDAEIWHDNGAYLRTHGVLVADLTATMLPGPYRLPAFRCSVHVVLTNKTPCGTYRGPGRYEGTFARERLLDVAAAELGADPIDLRRRNLLAPDELPHRRDLSAIGTELVLDDADYPGLLEGAVRGSRVNGWRREVARHRGVGALAGLGAAMFLEKSGLGPHEHAEVAIGSSGSVHVRVGATSLGQGVETVMAQIVAEELNVDPAAIDVVLSDTDLVPEGVGSWASRTTVVGGNAVALAAAAVATRAREVAAKMLETAPEDLRLEGGRIEVAGSPDRSVSLGAVSAGCDGGLRAGRVFRVDRMTYPYGVHRALVLVDGGTGEVRVERYAIDYEVGRAVNPTLVEGQLVGGAAQGIAGALLEEFRYDAEGQPLAATLTDYLLPTAAEMPPVDVSIHEEHPAPGNPLGVRGAGEGGASAAGAAIAAAVDDALGLPGAIRSLPIRPERVLELLRGAG